MVSTSQVIRACLLDLDGTIYEDSTLIEGAANALAALRSAGIPYRFATNTTRRSRAATVDHLSNLGVPATVEDVFSAPVAAARWLEREGARSIRLLIDPCTYEDFAHFEIDGDSPDHVVVADLGKQWSWEILNRAFLDLLDGAKLVAVQKNRYWKIEGELRLDAGPFVAALEYAANVEATLVGKPSRAFFESAAADLGCRTNEILMVGDDLDADIRGAKSAGLMAIAVRTGKFRPEDEADAAEIANAVLDSIAELPRWLGSGDVSS